MPLFLFLGGFLFDLVFFFDLGRAGAIDGTESAETTLPQCAVALQLGLSFDRETGPGDGGETGPGDGFARQLANTISILLDALEGFLDFVNCVLVRRKQAQRKIA